MNKFLILATILATVYARPDGLLHGHDGHVSVVQNTIGSYKFVVHLKDSSRSEERFPDGSVIGEYTIPDAHGYPQTIKYTAGKDGFRIIDGLPIAPLPVAEIPEVIATHNDIPLSAVPLSADPSPFAQAPISTSGLLLPNSHVVRSDKTGFLAA